MKLACRKCHKVYEMKIEGLVKGMQSGALCKCGYPLSRRGSARSKDANKYDVGVDTRDGSSDA